MADPKSCYAGKLLRVDLTSAALTRESFGPGHIDLFIGGRGVSYKILYGEVQAGGLQGQ
jgi:aldehyde:ferredoxin oxidoreductase